MSYEKHTWETGETITAEKLNNIENGIESINDEVEVILNYNPESGNYTASIGLNEIIQNENKRFYVIYDGQKAYGVIQAGSYGMPESCNFTIISGSSTWNDGTKIPITIIKIKSDKSVEMIYKYIVLT